ncbi:hypothetical protein [Pelagicoccus sp. SDUM812005]|uniref:hypothetical protein n=1 Tax=Pelagicoccus sp. SDUM812005 TaxID=3041257 RepID=UPI00280DB620|nr:hypothetical protein [Pelagicoccus sp. SDUM812005]MDQ8180726.1 hypothetical protein [Pelagicoccus sp. SDUM812005]
MKYYLLPKLLSARLHLSLALLLLVLQRSPALKLLLHAKHLQASAPVARILQSFALPAAALATPHALSGASTSSYTVEYINTPEVKVGVTAVISFSNSITPQSWTLAGELPPGLRVTDLRQRKDLVDGVIATGLGLLVGTPTQAGTYDFVLTPWSNPDGTGETAPEPDPGALRLSITVLPDDTAPSAAPEITFTTHPGSIDLSWQADAALGFTLAESSDLQAWTPVATLPQVTQNVASISFPITGGNPTFYRLQAE